MSENGLIEMEIKDGHLRVDIPCNTKAEVAWKDKRYVIGSGRYTW